MKTSVSTCDGVTPCDRESWKFLNSRLAWHFLSIFLSHAVTPSHWEEQRSVSWRGKVK